MYKICRAALAVVLLVSLVSVCEGVPKKTTKAKPGAANTAAPASTKVLAVVAGQPFMAVPASGPAQVSTTQCPDETAPATFTVRCSKPLQGIRVSAGDFTGPGRIPKANITTRLVSGSDLLSCDSISIGPTPIQLWVNVTTPKDCKAGKYVGSIGFFSGTKLIDRVPLQVTVLPLRLIGSSKQYALYTSLGPGASGGSELSGDAYVRFLSSAANLGFRAVSVNADPDKAGDAFAACVSAGLLGSPPVLSFAWGTATPAVDQLKAVESARATSGIKSSYCFCASCPSNDTELSAAIARGQLLRQARAQVAATVADDATAQKLFPILDGINYKVDMPYVQALLAGGTNRTNKWEWYWWDARQSISDNRLYSGIILWKSGLYGCMPFWMPKESGDKPDNLDSLLCEGLRQGIIDTRYITTYMKALRELKDKKRETDKEYIASTETYLADFLSKPAEKMTPADLKSFRARMAEFSIKLAAML